MVRAAANLQIENVVPDQRETGFNTVPEVTVFNQNTSAAPDEEFDQGWVIVRSPQFTDPILWHCFIIRPQSSFTADDCSTVVSNCSGQFTMPPSPVTLNITAGGIVEGINCANVESEGSVTDTTTHTVNVASQDAISTFNEFNTGGQGRSDSGPFPPGSNPVIAEFQTINSGDGSGNVTVEFAELNENGDIINIICSQTFSNISPGETLGINHNPSEGILCQSSVTQQTTLLQPTLTDNPATTQYFGLRTWSEDEQQPGFPAVMRIRTR